MSSGFTLPFEYKGIAYTLTKHPEIRQKLKLGTITLQDAILRPWYFRPTWAASKPFKLSANDDDAVRAAKDIIKGRTERPDVFSVWLEERDAKRSATIGKLAADWLAAGLPFSKTEPRTAPAAEQLRATITRALPWWKDKRAAAITADDHENYVVHRRAHNRTATLNPQPSTLNLPLAGSRSADLELSALSSLCQWAVKLGRIERNPFEDRTRYHKPGNVQHCHQFAPETDEELHRILAWFFTHTYTQDELSNRHKAADLDHLTRLAGGWLAFTALTGLRPEEPAFIFRHATLDRTPPKPAALPPGAIFPDRDGHLKMRVVRTKHGQNPFVHLHPAALDFLTTWNSWLDSLPSSILHPPSSIQRALFPSPADPSQPFCPLGETTLLNKRLVQCCKALALPPRKPKGIGRAFYVAVRRSQGEDDATIAGELGQTTNGKLIWSTYGDPDAMRGGALLDWIPEATDPKTKQLAPAPYAWTVLKPAEQQATTNIIQL